MRPVRLAVVLDQEVKGGGGFQQSLNAAMEIQKFPESVVTPVFYTTTRGNVDALRGHGISAVYLPLPLWRRLVLKMRRGFSSQKAQNVLHRVLGKNRIEAEFAKDSIDLVYFLSPCDLARDLECFNYIITLWDLSHRDDVEFPEVREGRVFEARERKFWSTLPKAVAVLVDSEKGRENGIHRYGLDRERVHVVPFSPAQGVRLSEEEYQEGYVDIGKKYDLWAPYVFYPAQYWSHKNHVYLLEGLRRLEDDYGYSVGAVFSGGDKGNLSYIKEMTTQLELDDRVRFAGFVRNEEIPYLYKQALALVMPTYFGPTNLPPLEAFHMDVPVLYPDKPGLRDQVGDAALLMDLNDPESMARQLARLLTEAELTEQLNSAGKRQLELLKSDSEPLEAILRDFQSRRRCWP